MLPWRSINADSGKRHEEHGEKGYPAYVLDVFERKKADVRKSEHIEDGMMVIATIQIL